jgi:hypothetical protein
MSNLNTTGECICGNESGTNHECERCRLIARVVELEAASPQFNEANDGVDRCTAFLGAMQALMKEHRVQVSGVWDDLAEVEFAHDDANPANGWVVDMQMIYRVE